MAEKLLDEISRKLEQMEADWAAAREAAREKQDRAFHRFNEALAAIAAQLVDQSDVVDADIVSQDDKLVELEAIDGSKVDEAIAHSVAHKVLDEMPEPVTDLKTVQVSDLSDASTLLAVNKEFTGLMKDLEVQDGLSFDPGGKHTIILAESSEAIDDDDVLTAKRLIVADVWMIGECPVQMKKLDVDKKTSDFDAHQVFGEMLEPQNHLKQAILKNVEIGASFDPGGSLISIDCELVDDKIHQKTVIMSLAEEQDDLEALMISFDRGVVKCEFLKLLGMKAVLTFDPGINFEADYWKTLEVVLITLSTSGDGLKFVAYGMPYRNGDLESGTLERLYSQLSATSYATEIDQGKDLMLCSDLGKACQFYVFEDLPQSASTSEIEHTDELLKNEVEHAKNILSCISNGKPYQSIVSEVYNLKVMPLLLTGIKPMGQIKLMLIILIFDDIEQVHIKMMSFDLGGGLHASNEVFDPGITPQEEWEGVVAFAAIEGLSRLLDFFIQQKFSNMKFRNSVENQKFSNRKFRNSAKIQIFSLLKFRNSVENRFDQGVAEIQLVFYPDFSLINVGVSDNLEQKLFEEAFVMKGAFLIAMDRLCIFEKWELVTETITATSRVLNTYVLDICLMTNRYAAHSFLLACCYPHGYHTCCSREIFTGTAVSTPFVMGQTDFIGLIELLRLLFFCMMEHLINYVVLFCSSAILGRRIRLIMMDLYEVNQLNQNWSKIRLLVLALLWAIIWL